MQVRSAASAPLADGLSSALEAGDAAAIAALGPAASAADEAAALLVLHDLGLAPLEQLGDRARLQGDPAVAALKQRLEGAFLARVDARCGGTTVAPEDAVAALRAISQRDRDEGVYAWLATDASWEQLVRFVAIEGGPDAGFDDLVALGQVGLRGGPKVVLGANYWDEMGGGELAAVHTVLHERMVEAIELPRLERDELPASALERSALNGVLATNRWLQPELLGALGLTELQAGPRCRAVVKALRRLGAPAAALPFYEEHAETDPRHGKEWLDGAVAPLVEANPSWGPRMVRGALWRAEVNRRLFADALVVLRDGGAPAALAARPA
jgi:hypothetical protein